MLTRCGNMARAWCWQSLAGSTRTCHLPSTHGLTGLKRDKPGNCHWRPNLIPACLHLLWHTLLTMSRYKFGGCTYFCSSDSVPCQIQGCCSMCKRTHAWDCTKAVQTAGALLPYITLCGCRAQQLRIAMAQWQNNSMSAAFHRWQDYVVTKTAHTAKVGTAASAPLSMFSS